MSAATAARLANDVAAQFAHLPIDEAAAAVAAHLRTFWDPRMRAQLAEVDESALSPVAAAARARLAAASTTPA